MGRHCGFEFYKLVDGKLEAANVVPVFLDENAKMCNWLNIDGRCEATDIFLTLVTSKEKPHGWFSKDVLPEDKYTAFLLMNHPELDGYEYHRDDSDGWFRKYFYFGIDKFKKEFDFDKAQKDHDDWIKSLHEEIEECHQEIESIRIHQENAKTKVAFQQFEEIIHKLKEDISSTKCSINEIEEDDYDYDHYRWIKEMIETVESLIEEDKDLIAVAYAND